MDRPVSTDRPINMDRLISTDRPPSMGQVTTPKQGEVESSTEVMAPLTSTTREMAILQLTSTASMLAPPPEAHLLEVTTLRHRLRPLRPRATPPSLLITKALQLLPTATVALEVEV